VEDDRSSRVLETGDVFFYYRPRVRLDEVHGLEDVQRFFVVLEPQRRQLHRRLVVGRKRLPDIHSRERVWAFVADIVETRTRGRRIQPGTRPAGEGRYALVDHDGHTHLVYVLDLPFGPGGAQRLFRIEPEASYIVAVRNPEAPAPPGTGLPPRHRPEYPNPLRGRFRDRRFIAVDPPELLDYEGAELVIIGASHDAEEELGIELDTEAERIEDAELVHKLRVAPDELPLERGELR
jgi:hypothetical protein